VPFVDLAAQQATLASQFEQAVQGMFTRTDWILGAEVEAFEREFAEYCETSEAVGTDSGLSAIELILRASGIGPGDEVITAANSFIATALAISHAGASPVLVDVDPATDNLDPAMLESAITSRTRAVIAVHLYGQPAEMDEIRGVADRHGLLGSRTRLRPMVRATAADALDRWETPPPSASIPPRISARWVMEALW
jgi:dTDP-4-amino-4,6-dideoxygalactose transaminase